MIRQRFRRPLFKFIINTSLTVKTLIHINGQYKTRSNTQAVILAGSLDTKCRVVTLTVRTGVKDVLTVG